MEFVMMMPFFWPGRIPLILKNELSKRNAKQLPALEQKSMNELLTLRENFNKPKVGICGMRNNVFMALDRVSPYSEALPLSG